MIAKDELVRLIEGNERYCAKLGKPWTLSPAPVLMEAQNPFAIILGCSDARVPVELIFDQRLGDLFVIRVAGNVVAPSQIGSIEFAAEKFGTRLVVVLGHSGCGAVAATVDAIVDTQNYSPNIQSIVDRIRPSVLSLYEIYTAKGGFDRHTFIARAVRANVSMAVSQLKHGGALADLVATGRLAVVGAEYDVSTGRVDFFDGVE